MISANLDVASVVLMVPIQNGCNGNFAVSSPGKVSYSGEFGFREVGVGDTHTRGILSNGTTMCWGSNSDGQLGEGSNTDSSVPVYVSSAIIDIFHSNRPWKMPHHKSMPIRRNIYR